MRTASERIELDDVMAVVADASALGLEALVDAAFAGRIADVEKEFAKASRRRHRRRSRSSAPRCARSSGCMRCGSTSRAARRRPPWSRGQHAIHFRRKPLVEAALKSWTSERLVKAMTMLGEASLEARLQSELSEAIARRALDHDREEARRSAVDYSPLDPADHLVELLERLVADLHLAALAAMRDRDREAERIGEPLLQRERVRVLLAARAARCGLAGRRGALLRHRLDLAHVQALRDDRLRQRFRIGLAEQRARMAGGELARRG